MARTFFALALALFTWLPSVHAAETVEQLVARLADEGYRSYKVGDYAAAMEKFQRAYAIQPVPSLLYNMALTHEKMGEIKDAYEEYKRYLATQDPNPKARRHAQEHLASLEPAYKAIVAPLKPVEPAKPKERIIVTAVPQKPAAPTGPTPEELAAQRRHKRNVLVVTGVVVAAVGVAGLAAGYGLYHAAASDQSSFQSSFDYPSKLSLKNDAAGLATASTASYIAGGVVAAVGVGIVIAGLRAGGAVEKPAATPAATSLAPVVAPGLAGLSLSGRF